MKLTPGLLALFASPLLAQSPGCPAHPSHIAIRSGTFSSQPGVSFVLHHFVATLVPVSSKSPECFTKITVVSHADIFVSNDSLTNVFAEKLGDSSKIKGFTVKNNVGKVTLSGHISKVIPIEFALAGPVSTDGKVISLEAQQIKADGIPVKALLSLIGEHVSDLLGLKGVKGVAVEGNTLSFSPEQIAHLKGHISSVETSGEGLTLHYGGKAGPSTPAK